MDKKVSCLEKLPIYDFVGSVITFLPYIPALSMESDLFYRSSKLYNCF